MIADPKGYSIRDRENGEEIWYEVTPSYPSDFSKSGFQPLGPIIRVNPEELFIHDPEFYNSLYVIESTRRTNHYDNFAQGIGFDGLFLRFPQLEFALTSSRLSSLDGRP